MSPAVALRSVDDPAGQESRPVDSHDVQQWKAIAGALAKAIGVPISVQQARRFEIEQGLRIRRVWLFSNPLIILDPEECERFAKEVLARTGPVLPPPRQPRVARPYRRRSE